MRRIATTKLLFTLGGVRAAMSTTASADSARDIVTFGGQNIGHVIVDTNANHTTIDYAVKNNGARSPGHREVAAATPKRARRSSIPFHIRVLSEQLEGAQRIGVVQPTDFVGQFFADQSRDLRIV